MKVLVVDGDPATRLGLKNLLGGAGDIRVVGETGDGCEALDLVEELRPQLVILGLNLLGELDGVEACWRLKALPKPPRVLVCASSYDSTGPVSSCLLVGADGYVHKNVCSEELLATARRTAAGEWAWRPKNEGCRADDGAGGMRSGTEALPPQAPRILRRQDGQEAIPRTPRDQDPSGESSKDPAPGIVKGASGPSLEARGPVRSGRDLL